MVAETGNQIAGQLGKMVECIGSDKMVYVLTDSPNAMVNARDMLAA